MIHFTKRLDKAICVAAKAHEKQGQHRKGSDVPYIIHPFAVMLLATQATDDEDVLIACLLHDVLEDVDSSIYSETDMRRDFGDRVAGFVKDVTKNNDIGGWHECAQAYLDNLEYKASDESIIVSAADKTHNITSIIIDFERIGDDVWQIFATKKAEDQMWWYESILGVIKKRQPHLTLNATLEARIEELKELIEKAV